MLLSETSRITGGSVLTRVRHAAKSVGASAIHSLSLDTALAGIRGLSAIPLIICYHRVVADFEAASTRAMPSLLVSCAMFEKQLDWLSRHFELVSLDDLAEPLTASEGSKRRAAITFDDGYADFYWHAFPILKRKGIPSAVFVVTDLIGTSALQTHDELYLLLSHYLAEQRGQRNFPEGSLLAQLDSAVSHQHTPLQAARAVLHQFSQTEVSSLLMQLRSRTRPPELPELYALDWSMLRSLSAQGVTIGSHTRSHALLPYHNNDSVRAELTGSRLVLEEELGGSVRHLAYPDGQFDQRTAHAAKLAGYTRAYTICSHQSHQHPELTVSRRVLWEHACTDTDGRFSPAILSCLVNGVFDAQGRCTSSHYTR